MNYTIKNVKIKSIATCVPANMIDVYDNQDLYKNDRAKLEKIVTATGFHIRHVLPKNSTVTALDLCYTAAKKVLADIDKDLISAIIFVSNTPDFIAPSNSSILQAKLELGIDTVTFDMNQGCAGFLHGLLTASKYIDSSNKMVLLLVGNTLSKIYGTGENAVNEPPFYGDGGSAVLLEYSSNTDDMYFSLYTDGSNFKLSHHINGGFRNQPSKEMFNKDESFNYGSVIDGLGVFQYFMNKIPIAVNDVLTFSNMSYNDIDYFLFHQSNLTLIKQIARILNISFDKVPYDILPKFGNLSVASIPGVITEMVDIFNLKKHKVLISSFGVGFAWGTCILTLDNIKCYPTIFIEA